MRMPESGKPIDYFFLARPTLLVPVWTLLLLGYYRGVANRGGAWRFLVSRDFVLIFLLYSALMGGVYILNQIVDRETDRKNEKLFLISGGMVPIPCAVCEMSILFAVPLIVSFFMETTYFILVLISLVMGVLYSVPPVRMKGRPLADLAFNALGYGLVNFLVGWAASGGIDKAAFIQSVPYCLAVGGVFANTTIPDIEGDRADRAITTGVLLGEVRTALLGFLLILLSVVASIVLRDFVCLCAALVASPFFAVAVLKKDRKWYLRSFRIGAPTLVIAAVVLFPYYLALLLITLLSMRFYYRRRFDLAYPSILSER
jgi:4-hydroxybenzoate polyprenyltransferase